MPERVGPLRAAGLGQAPVPGHVRRGPTARADGSPDGSRHNGVVTRRLCALVAVQVTALLVGCGPAKDAATDAASQAGNLAADEAKRQICAPVRDGKISARDKQVLSGLVATAKAAGVAAEITTPLEQIAKSGDQVPAESVTALRKACG